MATRIDAWKDKDGNIWASEAQADYADDIALIRMRLNDFMQKSPLVNETDRDNMVHYMLNEKSTLLVIASDLRKAINGRAKCEGDT